MRVRLLPENSPLGWTPFAWLVYLSFFLMVTLLILLISLAGLFFDAGDVQGRMVQEVGAVLGEEGAQQIRTMMEQADRPGRGSRRRSRTLR